MGLLNKYNLKPDKKLGQNFLIDQNVVNKIIDFAKIDEKIVLEIGAGPGTLTSCLSQRAKKVYAIEIDKKILNVLKDNCQNLSNVEIINEDFLKINVKKLTISNENNKILESDDKIFDFGDLQKIHIVGNLPYYITSQILFKIFENRDCVESFTIMVQKELGQRLLSKPGTKDYGILTVAMNFYCQIEDYFSVSKNVFYPKPEVDSMVIRAIFKENVPNVDEKSFFKFIRICFNTRRKTILNSISNGLNVDKITLERIFEIAGIGKSLRAEDLGLGEFLRLYEYIKKDSSMF